MMDLALAGCSLGITGVKIDVRFRVPLTIARIQAETADHYDLPMFEMTSARRGRDVAHARQMAMYLSRQLTKKSLPDIGRFFGNRDHTTVMHAIKEVELRAAIRDDVAEDIRLLRRKLAA